jgi:hypothetical protein
MTSHIVSIDRKGRASIALPGTAPGPAADGATIYEILNCPPAAGETDVIGLAGGLRPSSGSYTVDYNRLVERRNGSCCGGCGG